MCEACTEMEKSNRKKGRALVPKYEHSGSNQIVQGIIEGLISDYPWILQEYVKVVFKIPKGD